MSTPPVYVTTASPQSKVQGPAIALLVVAGLGGIGQLVNLLVYLLGAGANLAQLAGRHGGADDRLAGVLFGGLGAVGSVIALALAVLIAYGAVRMMNLRSYGLAMASAIIAIVPCISPCCCLGLPAGIWALVVLSNADVKQAFR